MLQRVDSSSHQDNREALRDREASPAGARGLSAEFHSFRENHRKILQAVNLCVSSFADQTRTTICSRGIAHGQPHGYYDQSDFLQFIKYFLLFHLLIKRPLFTVSYPARSGQTNRHRQASAINFRDRKNNLQNSFSDRTLVFRRRKSGQMFEILPERRLVRKVQLIAYLLDVLS